MHTRGCPGIVGVGSATVGRGAAAVTTGFVNDEVSGGASIPLANENNTSHVKRCSASETFASIASPPLSFFTVSVGVVATSRDFNWESMVEYAMTIMMM